MFRIFPNSAWGFPQLAIGSLFSNGKQIDKIFNSVALFLTDKPL